MTDIRNSAKEGDLIRVVAPEYTSDFIIYISCNQHHLILNDVDYKENGYILPGIAITYLAKHNLGTLTKINNEYKGVPIIGIKVPAIPQDLVNWKKASLPRYLEDKDDVNYVRYKNFKIYVGEEIAPEDQEFDFDSAEFEED